MSTDNPILGDANIEQFIATHVDARGRIERAARLLGSEPDGQAAMRKLLPALAENAVSVFFSYKKKDEEAAKAVVNALRERASTRLKITYQAEFTEEIAGKKWRDKIRESIRPANWFILLLPDPSDDWDWCLFETGFFVANRCSADRLICLHHPDTGIPPQIEDYHAVAATVPEVEQLLRMVYVMEDPVPGMPPIAPGIEEKLPEVAQEIVDAIRPPKKTLSREIFEPWVELRIDRAVDLESTEDLDRAIVAGANPAALDLFGFLRRPETWRDLRSEVEEADGDGRWRVELFHVLRRIARGRKFYPIQAVFKTKSGRMYRPVACAVDRVGADGPIASFHVAFSEDVTALDAAATPKDVSLLANVLRFTFRFRWEVLERFSKGPLDDGDVRVLDNTLRRIKKDWESRHVGDEKDIFDLFDEENRQRFTKMSVAWNEIKNDQGTGRLDVALANQDKETIPAMLAEFLPQNQEFLEIAAERFSELISQS
jgi:TIR domain